MKHKHDGKPSQPMPAPQAPRVVIEFPQEGEVVTSSEYTFRIAVPFAADKVELSLTGGDWQPCREAVGLWWFDWDGYQPGKYSAKARMVRDGKTIDSSERRFTVESEFGK